VSRSEKLEESRSSESCLVSRNQQGKGRTRPLPFFIDNLEKGNIKREMLQMEVAVL